MCLPPLKRIRTSATETTCWTVSSRGVGIPGTTCTAMAAATSIQTGAGTRSRADSRLTKIAASATALVSAMIQAYWVVSDTCCSSAESTKRGDCRPAFPAHRGTHYAGTQQDPSEMAGTPTSDLSASVVAMATTRADKSE
jgi:hypothetical protein